MDAETDAAAGTIAGELPGTRTGWVQGALGGAARRRPHLSAEDRRAAMEALMVRPSVVALRRFAVLLGLSVVVATVGLLQNSTAVVIGAMLIAPLMAPIMGIAASLVMGWGLRLIGGLALVGVSVAGAVTVGWVFAVALPMTGTALPGEVLSRSSPDVRDLLVALAAGAAGAFATVRKDVSGALPGVAVAVALVPPLAATGVLLGRGQFELARGAALLFLTNLVGIVLMAAVVFVLTGFVPARRVRVHRHRILTALAVAAVPTLAVGAVLTARLSAVAGRARQLELATRATTTWLGSSGDLNRIALAGNTVQVNVTGAKAPPAVRTLTTALSTALGHPTTVDLRWIPLREPTQDQPSAPALSLDQVRPVVQQWLTDQSLKLEGMTYDSAVLVVSVSGEQPPQSSDRLVALIDARFHKHPPISLAWTQAAAGSPVTAGPDAAEAIARTATDTWTQTHPGISVLALKGTDAALTVTLTGPTKPDVKGLQSNLRSALPETTITIQWIPGTVLDRATPTAPPATAGPVPSATPTAPAH